MYKHILSGCRSKPLASFLKAVGVLRLVAEQKDPHTKGWWEGEAFAINAKLNKEEFEGFFFEEYAPTTILAPWNGGSGFYMGDSTEGINAISNSEDSRFAGYRNAISQIKTWPEMPTFNTVGDVLRVLDEALEGLRPGKRRAALEELLRSTKTHPPNDISGGENLEDIILADIEELSNRGDTDDPEVLKAWWKEIKKARTKCNEIKRTKNKKVILPLCRARMSDTAVQWLDAVGALYLDGQAAFNPVLGTGGNEGRLELSNNFMQRLSELFLSGDFDQTRRLFQSAVFGTTMTGLVSAKIGQYDPGRSGGYNQGTEVETKDFKINPWDFVLAMEGALVLAGATVRRNSTDERSQFTTPFTVRFSSVGFSSRAYEEKGKWETWLPIWRRPACYPEIRYLFGEGRSSIGRRMVRNGIEFSRSVGTLGVDRGIDAFERYAFLKRRGPSYVALPAGRIEVRYRHGLDLLNELDLVTRPAWRFLRGFKNIPATFLSAHQRIDEAVFACCQNADAAHFGELVRSLGRLEKLIAVRDRTKKPALANPLLGLSPRWIDRCDDGSVEVRIAASLASIRPTGKVGPLRSNMTGVDPLNPRRWSEAKGEAFWHGSNLPERLAGVLVRRMMDAERLSAPRMPIEAALPVSSYDVAPFLRGQCDDGKIEDLLWGFTLIDWTKPGTNALRGRWKQSVREQLLSRTWCLLKLLHSPEKIRDTFLKRESRIAHLLTAGRIREACAVGIKRLRVSELHPFRVIYEEELDSSRLLASLLIPVRDQWRLESLVLETLDQENKNA